MYFFCRNTRTSMVLMGPARLMCRWYQQLLSTGFFPLAACLTYSQQKAQIVSLKTNEKSADNTKEVSARVAWTDLIWVVDFQTTFKHLQNALLQTYGRCKFTLARQTARMVRPSTMVVGEQDWQQKLYSLVVSLHLILNSIQDIFETLFNKVSIVPVRRRRVARFQYFWCL